ncbi:MAG: sugar phosphate isomerase/epimerase family protein [Pedobacter sp.]|jgi:sugar phosphate isomerase/epimerase
MERFVTYFWQLIIITVCFTACNPINKSRTSSKISPEISAEWQTGVALYSFNRFSFANALAKADSAGAKYVEGFFFHKLGNEFNNNTMGTVSKEEISKMKQMMDKKGIKMKSMYVGGAKNVSEWKFFFDTAKELGMQYLVCEPQKDHWDMLDSLAGLYKIRVAIHEHSKESSIYWHPDSVLAALKGHPNMGACADLGHWARSGLDPVKCLEKLNGNILGIHLKDIDRFNDTKANDVNAGTGVINFPGVVRELKRQNFNGMIYVECEHNMDNNLADVVQTIRYFENLAKK